MGGLTTRCFKGWGQETYYQGLCRLAGCCGLAQAMRLQVGLPSPQYVLAGRPGQSYLFHKEESMEGVPRH